MNYLTLIFDKSVLQGLSPREAKWLFHHFRINLPPVFFSELLADLTKAKPRTASAEGDVMALAKKITSYAVHTNEPADLLMNSELHGRKFPLVGQIAERLAEQYELKNGESGIFIDSTPTQDMLHRWVKGDFSQPNGILLGNGVMA